MLTIHLHKTFNVLMFDVTVLSGVLLAVQYARLPVSSLPTVLINIEIVSARPSTLFIVDVDLWVTSSDDIYHVMLAGG